MIQKRNETVYLGANVEILIQFTGILKLDVYNYEAILIWFEKIGTCIQVGLYTGAEWSGIFLFKSLVGVLMDLKHL